MYHQIIYIVLYFYKFYRTSAPASANNQFVNFLKTPDFQVIYASYRRVSQVA